MTQVLIAHLGEIVVDNSGMQNIPAECGRGENQVLINLSLTNMNLYSLHLGQQMTMARTGLNSSKLSELTQKFGLPILYDTSVDLAIGRKELDIPFINTNISSKFEGMMGYNRTFPQKSKSGHGVCDEDYQLQQISSLLDIKAKISSPVKLSLSKEVYEQILQTVDNLTYDGDPVKQPSHPAVSRTSSGATNRVSDLSKTYLNVATHAEKEVPTGGASGPGIDPDIQCMNSQDLGAGGEKFLAKHVEFEVPLFEVELCGDFGEGEQGLVDLKLYDFSVKYEKNDRVSTRINLHLKSLQMDDLLEAADSKHRQIIVSRPSKTKDM